MNAAWFSVEASSLWLAIGAGVVAAVNPCGFALLPAYLSLFVLEDAPSSPTRAVVRALRATAALTAGFASVFLLFGLVVSPVAGAVQAYLPAFTVVLGIVLALAGLWVASGRSLPVARLGRSRASEGSPVVASWRVMTGFGASYALASLGCTIAPFLAVVVTSFRSSSPGAGLVLFAATPWAWVSPSARPRRRWRLPAEVSSPGCAVRVACPRGWAESSSPSQAPTWRGTARGSSGCCTSAPGLIGWSRQPETCSVGSLTLSRAPAWSDWGFCSRA